MSGIYSNLAKLLSVPLTKELPGKKYAITIWKTNQAAHFLQFDNFHECEYKS
jgi:hypothetical protein